MECTNTGAIVYISDYHSRYICDVFKTNDITVFRIAGRITPESYNLHPITHKVDNQIAFFDKDVMSTSQNATLIVSNSDIEVISIKTDRPRGTTTEFISRQFLEASDEDKKRHRANGFKEANSDDADWDDPKYEWKYFGKEKYGRYAYCEKTKTARGLTMGEFYGLSPVD